MFSTMRSLILLATVCAATVGTSLALVDARERTTVGVTASEYDENRPYSGCGPDGCIPENTRDQNLRTRWWCQRDFTNSHKACWIKYTFEEPQDLEIMKIVFYKGNDKTLIVNVYTDGHYLSKIESTIDTQGHHIFDLYTDETSELMLYLDDYGSESDVWLSIAEVMLMVE